MSVTGDRLRAAAALVRQGWCQNAIARDGSVCALGAIGFGLNGPDRLAAYALEIDAIATALGVVTEGPYVVLEQGNRILAWNDVPGQTADNVAATLELAAILSDHQESGKQRAVNAALDAWKAV